MKIILLLAWFVFAMAGASAKEAPAETNKVEILWQVPANHLPQMVWIYKASPHTFAPPVVSNLMALAGFTMADKTNVENALPFKDESMLYFFDKKTGKELGIYPPLGWIYYRNPSAEAKKHELAAGVPDDAETIKLGMKYLQMLGIDRSQIATKGNSSDFQAIRTVETGGWIDKEHGTKFEQTYKRGVSFIRRMDGIDLTVFQGVESVLNLAAMPKFAGSKPCGKDLNHMSFAQRCRQAT
jgi:hypothetical protein